MLHPFRIVVRQQQPFRPFLRHFTRRESGPLESARISKSPFIPTSVKQFVEPISLIRQWIK